MGITMTRNTQVVETELGGDGGKVGRADLSRLDAADLDVAFDALARIGRRRGRLDPTAGTLDRALIQTLEGLQEVRRHLDRETVAAGLASPYIARHLRPNGSTRLAVAQAQREQRAHELAAQVERERRSAVHGRRGWETRQEDTA